MTATSVDLGSLAEATAPAARPARALMSLEAAEAGEPELRLLAQWIRSYLMRPHAELGRAGHVCPFTSQAAKLALVRLGTSAATTTSDVTDAMGHALRAFDAMTCTRTTRIFRTIIVAFPRCSGPQGIDTLHSAQNALRRHSVLGGKMIGLFEPHSQAEGLINPAFRPLRAPVPSLAIRMLVEQDAPFVLRNPLLAPIYLAKFPLAGPRRLWRSHRVAAQLRS